MTWSKNRFCGSTHVPRIFFLFLEELLVKTRKWFLTIIQMSAPTSSVCWKLKLNKETLQPRGNEYLLWLKQLFLRCYNFAIYNAILVIIRTHFRALLLSVVVESLYLWTFFHQMRTLWVHPPLSLCSCYFLFIALDLYLFIFLFLLFRLFIISLISSFCFVSFFTAFKCFHYIYMYYSCWSPAVIVGHYCGHRCLFLLLLLSLTPPRFI